MQTLQEMIASFRDSMVARQTELDASAADDKRLDLLRYRDEGGAEALAAFIPDLLRIQIAVQQTVGTGSDGERLRGNIARLALFTRAAATWFTFNADPDNPDQLALASFIQQVAKLVTVIGVETPATAGQTDATFDALEERLHAASAAPPGMEGGLVQ